MRALTLALLVLLLLPPAHAQTGVVPPQLAVAVEDPGRAFPPGGEGAVNVLVNYNPGSGAMPAPSPSEQYNFTEPTRITFSVKQLPSWVVSARFEPEELVLEVPVPATRTLSRYVQLVLNVSADAPALQREDVVVVAEAHPNGNIAGRSAESPPIKLRPAAVSLVNVTAESVDLVVPGGRWVSVPYLVRNDGNGPVNVTLNVTLRPEDSQVEFEPQISLARNETRVVEVRLRLPWTYGAPGTLTLEAVPLTDNDDGRPATADVEVNGQSAVPAPPLGLLAVLAVVAARLRRR